MCTRPGGVPVGLSGGRGHRDAAPKLGHQPSAGGCHPGSARFLRHSNPFVCTRGVTAPGSVLREISLASLEHLPVTPLPRRGPVAPARPPSPLGPCRESGSGRKARPPSVSPGAPWAPRAPEGCPDPVPRARGPTGRPTGPASPVGGTRRCHSCCVSVSPSARDAVGRGTGDGAEIPWGPAAPSVGRQSSVPPAPPPQRAGGGGQGGGGDKDAPWYRAAILQRRSRRRAVLLRPRAPQLALRSGRPSAPGPAPSAHARKAGGGRRPGKRTEVSEGEPGAVPQGSPRVRPAALTRLPSPPLTPLPPASGPRASSSAAHAPRSFPAPAPWARFSRGVFSRRLSGHREGLKQRTTSRRRAGFPGGGGVRASPRSPGVPGSWGPGPSEGLGPGPPLQTPRGSRVPGGPLWPEGRAGRRVRRGVTCAR